MNEQLKGRLNCKLGLNHSSTSNYDHAPSTVTQSPCKPRGQETPLSPLHPTVLAAMGVPTGAGRGGGANCIPPEGQALQTGRTGKQTGEGRQPQVSQGCSPLSQRHPVGAGGRAAMRNSGAVGPGMGEGGLLLGVARGLSPHPCHLPTGANGSSAGSRLGPRSVPRWDSCHVRRFPSAPCQPAIPQRS